MQPRQHPQLIVREEERGKYLVFNRENQIPLVLNTTSHSILSLCDGTREIDEICEILGQQYDIAASDIDPPQLSQIVGDHIELMQKLHILVV